MPDVSVVIACWNAAAFLPAAIGTALGQTGVSVEVLVCDDASTDKTPQLMSTYADPRVRSIRLSENRGPGGARNAGFALARGTWILILDADDTMEPDRAAKLVAVGERERADIVADNFWIEAADVPGTRRLHLPETLDGSIEEIDLAGFAKANILFGRSPALGYLKPLFRRDFLERANLRYDEELRIGEDFGLVAECLVRGARYVRSRSADYVYMTHDGSISHRLKLSDLQSMIDFDRRFLTAHPQLREQEDKAIRAHLQSLEVGEAFTIMVDHLKSRSISGFLSTALQRPSALHLLSMPIRARASRIAARLLAGRAGKGV